VMRRIMILSYCFVNIQLTFHLPPKRAAQHASPDCSDVSYPLDTRLATAVDTLARVKPHRQTALRMDVSRNSWREPNTQLQYYSYRLAVLTCLSPGADTDISMTSHP
jgi:hypothetical protein